ncbi:MAG: extracellular solute-binding protein [Erysipelotrichaceae bacterium]
MNYLKGLAISMLALAIVGCSSTTPSNEDPQLTIYTSRHYETDQALYDQFTAETGIAINVVKGEADQLIERLQREGAQTSADLFITEDIARISFAKDKDLLQPFTSERVKEQVPSAYRDIEDFYSALTLRARVLVFDKEKYSAADFSTFDSLLDESMKGKVLSRSSNSVYNQSLIASFIAIHGEAKTEAFVKGLVSNFARDPEGNDRDQAKAVIAGVGDVAIMNTYYLGKMLHSNDPEEVKVGERLGIAFADSTTSGAHLNASAVGISKYSKNVENANLFIEFMTNADVQTQFAATNFEYPVNEKATVSDLLQSWGSFTPQDLNLSELGEYNKQAVLLMQRNGWK